MQTSAVNQRLCQDSKPTPENFVNKHEHILSGDSFKQQNDLNSSIPNRHSDINQSKNNLSKTTSSEHHNQNSSVTDESAALAEDLSVLNEAKTASRMNDVSFVNKTGVESAENVEEIMTLSKVSDVMTSVNVCEVSQINKCESKEDSVEPENLSEQDALSISTMVPLLESTNLDITCPQTREINSNNDIMSETSIQLESSISERISNKHELSQLEVKGSPKDSNSNRYRNDSNCSNYSASHLEDKISETSSDRTASPNKERNSASPGKEQHGVVENGIQSSDASNCDTVSL